MILRNPKALALGGSIILLKSPKSNKENALFPSEKNT
jgi:hypothetical protein